MMSGVEDVDQKSSVFIALSVGMKIALALIMVDAVSSLRAPIIRGALNNLSIKLFNYKNREMIWLYLELMA